MTPLKPDGKILWVWGDNRLTLNSSLVQQSCTNEESEDVLYEVYVTEIFSKINLQNAFWQIPLGDGSKTLTTITTSFGVFAYNFLPFEISVSPSIFQKTTGGIINEIDSVVAFQDYVIVLALDQMTHNQRLSAILDRFIQYSVRINDHKYKFDVNKIDRLGLDFDINGIKPDPGRLPPPVEHLTWTAIGAIQYYSRFIPGFAERASSVFQPISSEELTWTKEHEETLRSLIAFIASKAVLRAFSMKLRPSFITDAPYSQY